MHQHVAIDGNHCTQRLSKMNSSPRQPDRSTDPAKQQESLKEAAERRRQQLLSMATTQLSATPSWGEYLLPIILAAMETCWVYAILIGLAGIGLFLSHDPILPLWAPFVLIAGSHWLANYLERRDASRTPTSERNDPTRTVTPGTSLVIALVAVVALFVIWLRLYAQTWFVFYPPGRHSHRAARCHSAGSTASVDQTQTTFVRRDVAR